MVRHSCKGFGCVELGRSLLGLLIGDVIGEGKRDSLLARPTDIRGYPILRLLQKSSNTLWMLSREQ